jgi:UPF0716 protein FxsA
MLVAFALLLLGAIVELYVIVLVANAIGVLQTILLLLAISFFGAWLVKREGVGMLRRVQDDLARGELPPGQLMNGFLLLIAGVILIIPGFVSDAIGLLLLLPPVRAAAAKLLTGRFRRSVTVIRATTSGPIIDTTISDPITDTSTSGPAREPRDPPPELEGP